MNVKNVTYLLTFTTLGAEKRFLAENIAMGPSFLKMSETLILLKLGAAVSDSTSAFGAISGGEPENSSVPSNSRSKFPVLLAAWRK